VSVYQALRSDRSTSSCPYLEAESALSALQSFLTRQAAFPELPELVLR